jgi:hypothetical protein
MFLELLMHPIGLLVLFHSVRLIAMPVWRMVNVWGSSTKAIYSELGVFGDECY